MKASIVIRAYNEIKHIGKLLSGIRQQNMEAEVILVDSGSTDGTVETAEKFGAIIVKIKPEEFSFGRALNIGCERASGDILIFASAHVYPVYNTWIKEMCRPFEDERVALVYGRQVGNELTKFSEHQLFNKWFPKVSDYDQHTPFCNNANCAIRKEHWQKYKYDEQLTGLEDLHWAKRIQKEGYKIVYKAEAPIVHVHEETPSIIFNRYRREAIALKKIMPEQTFSFYDFLKLFISNTFIDYYHALKRGKFLKNIYDIPMFRFNQFRGTYKGYRQDVSVSRSVRQRFYYPNGLETKKSATSPDSQKIDYENMGYS